MKISFNQRLFHAAAIKVQAKAFSSVLFRRNKMISDFEVLFSLNFHGKVN